MGKLNSRRVEAKAENGTPVESNGSPREAAYFLSLSLENVRCFGPKQTLDLSDGNGKPARWTIILGVNGTGKTTILQSLVGFEPMPYQTSEKLLFQPRFLRSISGNREDLPHRGAQEQAAWSIKFAYSRTLDEEPSRKKELKFSIRQRDGTFPDAWHSQYSYSEVPWCCAYGAGRRMGSGSLTAPGSDDSAATLFSEKAELRNPEEWLLRLDYAASKPSEFQERLRQRFERVKDLLLCVLHEVDDIRLRSPGERYPTPRAEFRTPYGWVLLQQLGFGYQTLITWVCDLASRMEGRYRENPDPLAEPAVVLVDEIDLHLHPIWQRKLIGFLTERFPNTQFIATAHSPLVAQAAADANLAVLRREGDHVLIDNDVDNIRNWRIDQILTSDLFGLETARPPQIEAKILERNKLLDKAKLTAAEKKRLSELNSEIEDLPFGETKQEREARDQIKKTLDLLMKERKPAS